MTLPTALQGAVITAASGYIISTGALRGAGFPPAPPLILITNKTVDKKSSQNPYMQDYARFFLQFLIGS